MRKILLLIPAALILFAGCDNKIDEFEASAGSANFTKYVSLGNSLTAGYADGALYHSAQQNAYPVIMATQFAKVGGGQFTIPVVTSEDGVLPGKRVLGYSTGCDNVTSLGPVLASGTNYDGITPVGYSVNNFGVPGAKSFHLVVPNYGNPAGLVSNPMTANPYFVRFASSPTTSVIQDAVAANATFFSLWIGNNDVLGYATSGGEGGSEAITGDALFSASINAILTQMTQNGAKGIVANLPEVISVPFFNTVPYNGLVLTAEQAAQLDGAYRLVEAALSQMLGTAFTLDVHFKAGANGFVIQDPSVTALPIPSYFKVRQLKEGELVLLTVPQDSLKCYGMGSFDTGNSRPYGIPGKYILDASEITKIQAATTSFNTILQNAASQFNLAFADVNGLMKNAKTGLIYDGVTMTAKFVTGGIFSLDGIHLNGQGNAVVANTFIDAINKKYNAAIPKANITDYPGVKFP